MARAAALCQAFQTQTLSPKATLATIVEELQVIVEKLQATYQDVWMQQATLLGPGKSAYCRKMSGTVASFNSLPKVLYLPMAKA